MACRQRAPHKRFQRSLKDRNHALEAVLQVFGRDPLAQEFFAPADVADPKPPRPIQDAQWLLECFAKVRGTRGDALLADVIMLAGLRGPRLETALAWLKLDQAIEIVGRGGTAMMRIPVTAANSSFRAFPHL
ncbi:TPA: hypothetical protein UMV35_000062 [Stenotrophomonas maltophilia]|uniref:hypothetical protein n=1 Tax=Stenotrophomonas TaxID=40323 RepID=UPI0013D9A547|nr:MULTISPECIES: hypothetical protein [Stenotrophomonas]MBH1593541.1 hypothetical protein [Stenotrophomonas maltophilia]MDH2021252.1 hypothetical protein [Stenotrophomonas sp. GD03680]HEL3747831.1 hypothetical protein [Stenotrophomonas maltophilia]HEL7728785.1 hypothetical protein [Stenotrophomonas maltophilia]